MRVSVPFQVLSSRLPGFQRCKVSGVSPRSLASASVLQQCESFPHDCWDDRVGLQERFSLREKGWKAKVEWKASKYGIGVFACEEMPSGSVIRVGQIGQNLLGFSGVDDLESFAGEDPAKWRYLQDYLWGLHLDTDELGYPTGNLDRIGPNAMIMMWIPGNGLNHNTEPNTVYRDFGNDQLNLVTLKNVKVGDELWDDYRRHGAAPDWLKQYAAYKGLTLNFYDCNDFVHQP